MENGARLTRKPESPDSEPRAPQDTSSRTTQEARRTGPRNNRAQTPEPPILSRHRAFSHWDGYNDKCILELHATAALLENRSWQSGCTSREPGPAEILPQRFTQPPLTRRPSCYSPYHKCAAPPPCPIRAGGPDLWYEMSLGDITIGLGFDDGSGSYGDGSAEWDER